MTSAPDTLVVWRFLDGKAGHRNQVCGLTDALARLTECQLIDVPLSDRQKGLRSVWPGNQKNLRELPAPDLIVGAGHSTHIPMLMARRRFGGRIVVLMKPSLPLSLFDQCYIPVADGVRERGNVLCTEGALNRVVPSNNLDAGKGLMLIGGPSDHFAWSTAQVLEQVTEVIRKSPDMEWTLTTSRRTPPDFVSQWKAMSLKGSLIPAEDTGPMWLPAQLREAGTVWVTADSVSMLYEALTAGGNVGLFELPHRKTSRVTRGVNGLITQQRVQTLNGWRTEQFRGLNHHILNEAARCAEHLLQTIAAKRLRAA
ncbi:MAG: mitochondrial fission ELM1 family protein [Planctomycetaceae bacterium]